MLRCIIVDDEPLALDLLQDNISNVPFLKLEARCKTAVEALAVLQEKTIDLVFCDIQMPGLNGLQFIRSLVSPPMFIMITAYENYALQGYELNVVDYLLKPVSYERFLLACNKALELQNLRAATAQAEPVKTADENNFIFVQVDYSMVKVVLSDIKMIEALKDYVKIYFTDSKKPLLVRMSMKALEDMLPDSRFLRIHKSYIVSVDCITAVRKNSVFIQETELPVGEQYKNAVARLTGRQY
ncbi:LytR/AlgR family response regulator transcription factor [Chitinophagaceae bacterium MMS25-I14]